MYNNKKEISFGETEKDITISSIKNKQKYKKKPSNKTATFINNKKKKRQEKRKCKKQENDWNFIRQEAQWSDRCEEIDNNNDNTLRMYCQNVNGIYDGEEIGLDEAFHYM